MTDKRENPQPESAHLDAALDYLHRGWAVVPAGARTKRPIIPWRRYQHILPTAEQIRQWFGRWPAANLAVITGQISGIVVVDIDPKHGGEASIASMEARHGQLPPTVEAVTGGGGRHLYFAHPGHEVRNRAGFAPGIDMRGDGGCIIVPPSVHPSGKPYIWKPGRGPGQIDLARLPVWLEQSRFQTNGPHGHPIEYWRRLVHDGVKAGLRNSTIASFSGHLLWHGVDPDVILELMLAWNRVRCDPPLDDEEVIETVMSIERTHSQTRSEP